MNSKIARIACASLVALTMSASVAAAQASIAGTWKLNLAKSQLGGSMYTIEKKGAGWHYSGGGFEADFDMSGKDIVMPSGASVSAHELSPTSWELTFKMNGKVMSKSKLTVNGNSINGVSTMTGPDGKTMEQSSTDTRVSGGPGFAGKWKTGEMKGSAATLKIAMNGASGITFDSPEAQVSIKGSFDGKDYPVMQAGQATKMTNAFTKISPTSFKVVTKMGGKEFVVDTYTLSADGKTLTDESVTTATSEKTKSVFDKQ